MLLTVCEKGLDEGIADVAPAGLAANSVLQVRTRSGGSVGGEATVAYPIAVYVFSGEECRAVQTVGNADAALAALGAVGISDWAVPTKAQMQLVEAKLLADDASLAGMKYLYRKSNDGLGYRSLGADETSWPTANTTDSYRLRPVAVVSITKE